MEIIKAEVTDNNDPLKKGRIKFRSKEYLSGEEHPEWAEALICSAGLMWGFFIIPEVGQDIYVIISSESENTTPIYLGSLVTMKIYRLRLLLGIQNEQYLSFMIHTFCFDVPQQTINVFSPLVNIGATCIGSIDEGVVRKIDLQGVIDTLTYKINQSFAKCKEGEGVQGISNTNAQSSLSVKAGI